MDSDEEMSDILEAEQVTPAMRTLRDKLKMGHRELDHALNQVRNVTSFKQIVGFFPSSTDILDEPLTLFQRACRVVGEAEAQLRKEHIFEDHQATERRIAVLKGEAIGAQQKMKYSHTRYTTKVGAFNHGDREAQEQMLHPLMLILKDHFVAKASKAVFAAEFMKLRYESPYLVRPRWTEHLNHDYEKFPTKRQFVENRRRHELECE
ncbi:hypothetical protein JCM5353_006972 [Sporobolomyces roseus]